MFEILFKKMAGTSEVLPANVRPALPSYCQVTPKSEGHDSFHAYDTIHAKAHNQSNEKAIKLAEVQLPHRERAAVIRTFR